MALDSAGGSCIPDTASSSAFQAVSVPPENFVKVRRASGARRPARKAVRDQQRSLAAGVAQQPGGLLDRQQLVDIGVLMVDRGGERSGQFVQRYEQRSRRIHVFLGEGRAPRSLRLADLVPEFLLLRGQGLEQAIKLRHQRLLLGEFDGGKRRKRAGHRRRFGVAQAAHVFLDVGVHRLIGIQQPVGGGSVGAQIVHRLEKVRRGVGDHRDAAGDLQAGPGIPRVEREPGDDAECGDQDDGLQQRGYGQTIQHKVPRDFVHSGTKLVKI